MARLRINGVARTRAFRATWMAKELGLDYENVPIETDLRARASRNISPSTRTAACRRSRTTRAPGMDLATTPRLADWLRRCHGG